MSWRSDEASQDTTYGNRVNAVWAERWRQILLSGWFMPALSTIKILSQNAVIWKYSKLWDGKKKSGFFYLKKFVTCTHLKSNLEKHWSTCHISTNLYKEGFYALFNYSFLAKCTGMRWLNSILSEHPWDRRGTHKESSILGFFK
jgi:hypothetical protein